MVVINILKIWKYKDWPVIYDFVYSLLIFKQLFVNGLNESFLFNGKVTYGYWFEKDWYLWLFDVVMYSENLVFFAKFLAFDLVVYILGYWFEKNFENSIILSNILHSG